MSRRVFLVILMLLFVPWITLAQTLTQTPPPIPEKTPPLWLTRAQTETSQIAELALDYSQFDRANLYAQLGEYWWKVDEAKGREWWQKAADLVTFISLQASADERKLQLRALRAVLRRVGSRDKKLAARLTEAMQAVAKQTSEVGSQKEAGDVLLNIAWDLADEDAGKAKALASAGIQSGSTNLLWSTLIKLRTRDAQAADALFVEVLALARARGDDEMLGGLVRLTVWMEELPSYNYPRTPEPLRLQALKAVIERLLRLPQTEAEKASYCKFVLNAVVWLRGRLLQLLPEHAVLVQQTLNECQNSFSRDSIEGRALSKAAAGETVPNNVDDLFEERPKTVADKLALARKTSDAKARTRLLWQAAQQAAGEDDPDGAVSILEGMTTEERRLAQFWDDWRGRFAAQAAQKYLKQKEYAQARKVIEAVPQRLAAVAIIECLGEMTFSGSALYVGDSMLQTADKREVKIEESEKNLLVEWLTLARKRLADAESDALGKQSSKFLTLVSLYAALQPVEALPGLNEAVGALNHAFASEQEQLAKTKPANETAELRFLPPQSLPGSFVRESFDGIRLALHELDSKDTKTRLHLGLLQMTLDFHEKEAAAKAEAGSGKEKQPPEKPQPKP